jgi:hypothetical protein
MAPVAPKLFVSYSHDSENHKDWVLTLATQVMANVTSDRIIPLIRANNDTPPVPTFLSSRVYIDFRDDLVYEARYGELVREIHVQKVKPRPPLGTNPFAATFELPRPSSPSDQNVTCPRH